jgi:hypothetical protein
MPYNGTTPFIAPSGTHVGTRPATLDIAVRKPVLCFLFTISYRVLLGLHGSRRDGPRPWELHDETAR